MSKTMEYARKDLEHVRLVSFSFLAICVVLLCLVLSSWTDANEVLLELQTLEQQIADIQNVVKQPKLLENIIPEVGQGLVVRLDKIDYVKIENLPPLSPSPMINFQRALQNFLGQGVGVMRDNLPPMIWKGTQVLAPVAVVPTADSTLEDIRKRYRELHWQIEVIDHFEGDSSNVKKWIKISSEESGFMAPIIEGPIVANVNLDPLKDAQSRKIIITLEMIYEVPVVSPEGYTIPPTISDQNLTLTCVTRLQPVSPDPDWFDKTCAQTITHWDALGHLTLRSALDAEENAHQDELKKQNVQILDMEFTGEHLGLIGPCLVGSLMIYMLAYLINLAGYLVAADRDSTAPMPSPWIGTMGNVCARLVTVVILIFVPAISVWLSVWRLSEQTKADSILAGLVIGMLGLYCVILGWRVKALLAMTGQAAPKSS